MAERVLSGNSGNVAVTIVFATNVNSFQNRVACRSNRERVGRRPAPRDRAREARVRIVESTVSADVG
jgi:hypothetical protein